MTHSMYRRDPAALSAGQLDEIQKAGLFKSERVLSARPSRPTSACKAAPTF